MPQQSVDPAISSLGHGTDDPSAGRGGAPKLLGEPLRLQELGNKQRELLDVISSIRDVQSLNIELPQIVVVGEQSAGKSSALEAITGIPFLKDVGACTRYPTEIRLRKADVESYRVKIIPDKKRDSETRKRLYSFGTRVNMNTPFKALFKAASDEISKYSIGFATHDTLVIDLAGKDKPHLTLVDLPGLVRNRNNDQSAEDIAEIAALTDEYMKNPRTLILAVIGGNSDYVQADILEKVRQFDPTGSRTIGVLTKPDAATPQGLHDFLTLVSNKDEENKIKLGWHVLRNPGQDEHWTDREKEEDIFFMSPPWDTLPKGMTRAKALATKLSEQLARHIASYIPELKEQVRQELDTCEKAQKALGEGLDDDNEMRQKLTALLNRSAQVTRDAAHGNYINDPDVLFFISDGNSDNPPHEYLRARVVSANEQFAKDMRTKGHSLGLTCDSSDVETQPKSTELKRKKEEYAATNVARMIEHSRGSHLDGDTSHHVPYLLVSNHSSGWKALADNHLEEIDSICQGFVDKVLAKLWPSHMHDPLRRHLLNAGTEACKREASEQVKKLAEDLAVEVQAYSPLYKKRLDDWCAKHHPSAKNTDEHPESLSYTVPEFVLEKSLILYEIIAGTFVRNVIVQAVERGFMRGLPTIFASEKVVAPYISDETVRQIVRDNPTTRKKRLQLKEQAKELREAYTKINNLRGKIENPTVGTQCISGRNHDVPFLLKRFPYSPLDEGIADSNNDVSGDQGNKGGDPGSSTSIALLTERNGTIAETISREIDATLSSMKTRKSRRFQIFQANFDMEWDLLNFLRGQEYDTTSEIAVEHAITVTGSSGNAQALSCCLADGTELDIALRSPKAAIVARGGQAALTELCEQLAWLGAALRASPVSFGLCLITPSIMTSKDARSSKRSLTWHFLFNEDGKRIPYYDFRQRCPAWIDASEVGTSFLEARNVRNFVGWASHITRHLGTAEIEYDKIDWAGAKTCSAGLDIEQKLTISVSKILGGSVNAVRGNRDKPDYVKHSTYSVQIKHAREIYAVLYDVESQRGWLVDGASALLHLVRTQVVRKPYGGANSLFNNPNANRWKFEHPAMNGCGNVAVDILNKESNMKHVILREFSSYADETIAVRQEEAISTVDEDSSDETNERSSKVPDLGEKRKEIYKTTCFRELVTQTWSTLEQIYDRQIEDATTHATIHLQNPLQTILEGYELMSIVSAEHILTRRYVKLQLNGEAWIDFTKRIHAITLFGQHFGDIYKPTEGLWRRICDNWRTVPRGHEYLAAPISLLQEIKQHSWRQGQIESNSPEIVKGFLCSLSEDAFRICEPNCKHSFNRVQRPRPSTREETLNLINLRKKVPQKADFAEINGALLFGKSSDLDMKQLAASPPRTVHAERSFHDSGIGSSLQASSQANSSTASSSGVNPIAKPARPSARDSPANQSTTNPISVTPNPTQPLAKITGISLFPLDQTGGKSASGARTEARGPSCVGDNPSSTSRARAETGPAQLLDNDSTAEGDKSPQQVAPNLSTDAPASHQSPRRRRNLMAGLKKVVRKMKPSRWKRRDQR
ncbi:hypothetical protein DL771_004596 [Monosporascus sp. 5C6A]|nr:hypothetical protein DL771_004596 [Monosporascus sp. 5C6A]